MYLLYRFETDTSGIRLARSMKIRSGDRPPSRLRLRGLLIRWGTTEFSDIDPKFNKVINPAKSIHNASDKIKALSLLKIGDVRIPPFSREYATLFNQGFLQIVGQPMQHSGGKGFVFYQDILPEQLPQTRDYYLRYIEGEEYRVLKGFNNFLLYRRVKARENADPFCRSTENGWTLRRVSKLERLKDLWIQASKACDLLDLKIAGVDLRITKQGLAYVLEVNTAPRLNTYRCEFIRKQIQRNI